MYRLFIQVSHLCYTSLMKTLVIGSADIDMFLTLPQVNSYVENQNTITFNLGDKVPANVNALTLGGNGANVSVGLRRQGVDTSFYTYLGADLLATQIKETIKNEHVDLIDHQGLGDNTSLNLIFDFDTDRIIFTHHEEKQHVFDKNRVKGIQALYLTSIGKEWTEAYRQILSFIHESPLTVAFSPGSPQLATLEDVIYELMAASQILFVNKEEGERIIEKKGESANDLKQLLAKLAALGPQIVSVTDGKKGAYTTSQGKFYAVSSFDEKQQGVDKTGAGDAYASGFFGAYVSGLDLKTCMRHGAVNAFSVMGKIGAQPGLLTQDEIQRMLGARPDFTVQQI